MPKIEIDLDNGIKKVVDFDDNFTDDDIDYVKNQLNSQYGSFSSTQNALQPQPTIEQIHVPKVEEMPLNEQINVLNQYPGTLDAHPELADIVTKNANNEASKPLEGSIRVNNPIAKNVFNKVKNNSIPVKNLYKSFKTQEPFSTKYSNDDILTNDQRLALGLPLVESVSNNGLANKYEDPHPFRDFGTSVGRFFLPKKLENALYGTMEERELLKSGSEGILTPDESKELFQTGQISAGEYASNLKRFTDYNNALLDRKQREMALKSTGEAAAELGLTLIPVGKGVSWATKGLGKLAYGLSKTALNPQAALKTAKAIHNVKKVANPLLTDAAMGATFGAGTKAYEDLAGIENDESYGGSIGQGALGGLILGGAFRGAGATGKALMKTEAAQKAGAELANTYDSLINSTREAGQHDIANALEEIPADIYRVFNTEIAPKKWFSDNVAKKTALRDLITDYNSGNKSTLQKVLNDVTKIENSYSDAEQEMMNAYAQTRTNLNGDLIRNEFEPRPKAEETINQEQTIEQPKKKRKGRKKAEPENKEAQEAFNKAQESGVKDNLYTNIEEGKADAQFLSNLTNVFKNDKNARKGRPRGSKNKKKTETPVEEKTNLENINEDVTTEPSVEIKPEPTETPVKENKAKKNTTKSNKVKPEVKEAADALEKAQESGVKDNLYTKQPKTITLDEQVHNNENYFKPEEVNLKTDEQLNKNVTKLESEASIRAKEAEKNAEKPYDANEMYSGIDNTSEYVKSGDYAKDLAKAENDKKRATKGKKALEDDSSKIEALESKISKIGKNITNAKQSFDIAIKEGNRAKATRYRDKIDNLAAQKKEASEKLKKLREREIDEEIYNETNDFVYESPEEANADIKADEIRNESIKETSTNEYSKFENEVTEVETESPVLRTKYNKPEIGKFIEDVKKVHSKGNDKDTERFIADIIKKNCKTKNDVDTLIKDVYNEVDTLTRPKNFKVGEHALKEQYDKDSELLYNLQDKILEVASSVKKEAKSTFGLSAVNAEENAEANNKMVRYAKDVFGKKYNNHKKEWTTEKTDNFEEEISKLDEAIANATSKAKEKELNRQKSRLIDLKREDQRSKQNRLYAKPETSIYNELKGSKDIQKAYDNLVNEVTAFDNIKYDNAITKTILSKINKIATKLNKEDGAGIKLTNDVNTVIRRKGDAVMKDLALANSEGDLSKGFEIIEKNKDLIEYNLDKDYNAKFFSDKAIEEHYDMSFAKSTKSLKRLMDPETRRSELIEIYKEKQGKRIDSLSKKGKLTKAEENEVLNAKDKLEQNIESVKTASDKEVERMAIARAREIYGTNRRLIKRYMTDYSNPSSVSYRKDGTWYRHYFDKNINDDFNPSDEFKRYDNKVRTFLDEEHWKENPFEKRYEIPEEKFAKSSDVESADVTFKQRDLSSYIKDNRQSIGSVNWKLSNGAKDVNGKWHKFRKDNNGKLLPREEQLKAYNEKIVKPLLEAKEKITDPIALEKFDKKYSKTISDYNKYEEYLKLKENYKTTRDTYKAQEEFRKDASTFATKTVNKSFEKADSPFKKDWQDYYDTKTGKIDKELIANDLKKMENPDYIKRMAKAEAEATGGSYRKILYAYKKKATELKNNYNWQVEGFNGYEKEAFKFGNKVEKEPDHYFAKEMSEHPETSVIFTTDKAKTHGNIAEAVFSSDRRHKIFIDKNQINDYNELTILGEEIEHIKTFDDYINGKRTDINNLVDAFKKSDETHLQYDMNSSLIEEIDTFVNKHGADAAKEVLTPEQIKIKENIDLARENQANTNLEREAHGSYRRRFSESTEGRLDNATSEVSTGSKDSDGTISRSKGRSSNVSDVSSSEGEGKSDLSVFNGKGLNKVKATKTFSKLVDELSDTKKNAMNKRIEDAVSLSDLLDATASDFGVTKDQAINRKLMEGGLLYMKDHYGLAKEPKNLKEMIEGAWEYFKPKMAWNKKSLEKKGTFGKKTKEANVSKFSETQYANKLELEQRLAVKNIVKYVKENYAKPLDSTGKGLVDVNEKLLNITIKNKYGNDFFSRMSKGPESIKQMFRKDPEACKAWLEVAKEIDATTPDFKIPKDVYKHLMIDTGEKAQTVWNRYGWKKGAIKYAQALWDFRNGGFVRRVLSLNPGWAVGNTINDTYKVVLKKPSAFKYFFEALNPRKKTLPKGVTEDNLFEANKAWVTYQNFTDNNAVDCVLNLLSGRSISTAELSGMKKLLAVGANIVNMPRMMLHGLSKANMAGNNAVQTRLRTMVYYDGLEEYQKARCKNVIRNIYKQKAYMEMLSKKSMMNEDMHNYAMKQVYATLGDYATASPMEQKVIQRIAPFYKWYRHITQYVCSMAKEEPTKLALTILNLKKVADDDIETRDYQKGFIQLNDNGFGINAQRYLNPFDTHSELVTKPGNVFAPGIKDLWTAGSGTGFNGKPLKSPNYETGYGNKVYDIRNKKYLKNKNGDYIHRTPLPESLKYIPVSVVRDIFPEMNSNLFSLEKIATSVKNYSAGNWEKEYKEAIEKGDTKAVEKAVEKGRNAKAGKFEPADAMYDTSFLGFNKGDIFVGKNKKGDLIPKTKYATSYSPNQRRLRTIVGGMAQNRTPLEKDKQSKLLFDKLANNERFLNLIPTKKYFELKKLGDLYQKRDEAFSSRDTEQAKMYSDKIEEHLSKIKRQQEKMKKRKNK